MAVKKQSNIKKSAAKTAPKITKPQSVKAEESTRVEVSKTIQAKSKKRNLIIGILVILGVALVIALRGQFVVATVNGDPISRITFIQQLEKEVGQKVLDSLVTKKLITQEAKKKNITVSKQEIDEEIGRVEKNLKDQGQELNMALKQQGISMDQFKEQISIQLMLKKLVADKVKATDKEISDYLEKNKDSLPQEMGEAELKKAVLGQLEQQKFSQAVEGLIESLKTSAKINYYLDLK